MKRLAWPLALAVAILLLVPALAAADNGNPPPTLSFFSGGGGAHAGWIHTDDQPPGDTDQQAMQIHDTTSGYAGVLVHHVYGIPTASFPSSKFDFKSNLTSASLGYPRLVIIFSDGGNASLRPLTWQQDWRTVQDPDWDNNAGGICGFRFEQTWQQIQACHPGTFITNAFITTDPGVEVTFLIDNLTVDGKNFSNAGDNSKGDGDNTTATDTPALLPPM